MKKIKFKNKLVKLISPISIKEYCKVYKNYMPNPILDSRDNFLFELDNVAKNYHELTSSNNCCFGIYLKHNIIGVVECLLVDNEAKMKIIISDNINRNQGYGKISFSIILRYLKNILKVPSIFCETNNKNDAMMQILKENGFLVYKEENEILYYALSDNKKIFDLKKENSDAIDSEEINLFTV